jgi:hypothetical protein
MSKAKKQQTAAARSQLEQEIHLVRAPGAQQELQKAKAEKLKVAVEEAAQEEMQE